MSKETFKSGPLSVDMLSYSKICPKKITIYIYIYIHTYYIYMYIYIYIYITKGTCVNQTRPTKEQLAHVCHYDRAMSSDSPRQCAEHARSTELQEIYKEDKLAQA